LTRRQWIEVARVLFSADIVYATGYQVDVLYPGLGPDRVPQRHRDLWDKMYARSSRRGPR
jgi:hypothetical protein